jgi:peptidoglycan hydrolase-like protein with peptidoglycan-binding domain
MTKIPRRAVVSGAAVITAAATAFITTGSAHAATALPAAQAAHAAPATQAAPALPGAISWPLVVQGNKGERVVDIQYLLNQRIGAGLAIDGVFGPATAAAVRKFQSANHLSADGQVGPQTWAKLIITVQHGNSGPAVAAVQHNLRYAYGYSSLAVDGVFGPDTQAPVRSFQTKYKISVDGIVGPATWNALIVHEA